MNRVDALTTSLNERCSELETARAKLAEHETLLSQAQVELQASNGDFATWESIDNRVRFETRQTERYRGIVEQCQENVRCSTTALESAQREQRISELQASRAERQSRARKLGAEVGKLIAQARSLVAASSDLLGALEASAESRDCNELRRLGATASDQRPLHAFWLGAMAENHSLVPTYHAGAETFERNIREQAASICCFEHQEKWGGTSVGADVVVHRVRSMLGDTAVVTAPVAPKAEPQPSSKLDYTSERFFGLHSYRVRVEHDESGREQPKLLLPTSSTRIGASVVQDRTVELAFGLEGRLVRFDDGYECLLAPAKPLGERASDFVERMLDAGGSTSL